MKKAVSIILALVLILSLAACGAPAESRPDAGTTGEESTSETLTTAVSDGLNEVITDLGGYPADMLGRKTSAFEEAFGPAGSCTFANGRADMLCDEYPNISFFWKGAGTGGTFDGVIYTLLSVNDIEVYPGLAVGKTYDEYAGAFVLTPCEYDENYACYVASGKFIINGRDAVAYLFFGDKDSSANSVLMTVNEKPEFSTIPVKEDERDSYPLLYLGRSVPEMQEHFGDYLFVGDDFDDEVRKTAYITDGEYAGRIEADVSGKTIVKNVIFSTGRYEVLPGIKVGDSAEKSGVENLDEYQDSYYYGSYLVAGYLAEIYVNVENDKITSFSCLCKQLQSER